MAAYRGMGMAMASVSLFHPGAQNPNAQSQGSQSGPARPSENAYLCRPTANPNPHRHGDQSARERRAPRRTRAKGSAKAPPTKKSATAHLSQRGSRTSYSTLFAASQAASSQFSLDISYCHTLVATTKSFLCTQTL